MKKDIKQEQDKILYQQFLDGNMESFENLIMKYKNNLLYFIFKYVKDVDVAEDIFQDTAMYLLSKKEIYNFDYSFKSFLYTIAKSRALNYIRQNKYFEEIEDLPTEEKLLEEIIIENELDDQIKKVISKLKKDYQMVIFLTLIEDLSYSEVATIMNKNVSQIKNLVHRARVKLKTLLVQEKIIEIRNNKIVRLISIILIVCALTSGIVYAGMTIYQNYFERKIEVNEPTAEEIRYSMQNGNEFAKIGKTVIYADKFNYDIYKFDLETNQSNKLCSIEGVDRIYFDGEFVYAMPHYYTGKGIYKIDLSGNIEKIYEGASLQLLVTEDEIYFVEQIGYDSINQTPQGNLCKMDKNGNNVETIIENIKHNFYIVDNYIYYIDKDSRSLFKADIDGQNKIEIVKGRIIINAVTDKYLSYTDSSGYTTSVKNVFIGIIFFDTNEHFTFDCPYGFYANNNDMYFYTSVYDREENKDINKLFFVDVENSKVIEKWCHNDSNGIPYFLYAYNGKAYFHGSNYFRLGTDNKNEKEILKFATMYFLEGKAYEFNVGMGYRENQLNIFELDNLNTDPVIIKIQDGD